MLYPDSSNIAMKGEHTVRALNWMILAALTFLSSSGMAESRFVGAEKCMSCHRDIYKTWQESTHYRAVQEVTPTHNGVIAQWKGVLKLKSGNIPEETIKLDRGPDGEFLVTLVDIKDPAKGTTYKVLRTQGAGSMKGQNYYTKIGNNYYLLPIYWETISSKFTPASFDMWYNDDGSLKQPPVERSWEMTCAGCHQTGLEYKKVQDRYEATYTDLSIGCEKCHGPGSEHVKSPSAKNIVNPRELDYDRGLDVCNQCHATQGRSVPKGTFRGAWNEEKNVGFKPGEVLGDYMQSGGMPGSSGMSKLSARDGYHSLAASKHYEAKTSCFDCHNPHGGPVTANLKRGDMDNSLCLYCHATEAKFATPEAIMKHTKHSYDPDMKGTSRCTGCHTVQSRRMRTPSVNGMPPGGMGGMMVGFLAVSKPQQSLEAHKANPKAPSTNACNKCHKEWGGDEEGYRKGVEAYKTLFGE